MSEILIETANSTQWVNADAIRQRRICGLPVKELAGRDEDGMWSLVEDAKTKTKDGDKLTASDFAFVGDESDPSTWKLPIHDAAHVRAALARFNQTQGIPSDKKTAVLDKIKAAAKKFGIDVSKD